MQLNDVVAFTQILLLPVTGFGVMAATVTTTLYVDTQPLDAATL